MLFRSYYFTVSTPDGREIYRCSDYSDEGEEYSYSQVLFRNDPASKMGLVKIHFPDMNSYISMLCKPKPTPTPSALAKMVNRSRLTPVEAMAISRPPISTT